jgi:hypothetical protein
VSRVLPLCALALGVSIGAGCANKDDPESGTGAPSAPRADGQPLLRAPSGSDKKVAVNRLKQIGLALHNYHDSMGTFPAGYVGPDGKPGLSWRVAILPYIEEGTLHREFKLNEPWDSEHNKKLLHRMPQVYEIPGTIISNGKTFYRSFVGPNAFIPGPPPGVKVPMSSSVPGNPNGSPIHGRRITSISDGTSNTLMVAEAVEGVEWTKPDDLPFTDGFGTPGPLPRLGGHFEDGFHALFCDGSVRFFRNDVNEQVLRALISVAGGEVVNSVGETDDASDWRPPPSARPPAPSYPSGKYGTRK